MRLTVTLTLAVLTLGCAGSPPSALPAPKTPSSADAFSPPSRASAAVTGASVASPGMVGTAAPLLFEAASPTGTWTVICQARADSDGNGDVAVQISAHGELQGDRMRRYFVNSTGPGVAIDEFVGHDATGRYVGWLDQGRLLIRDTQSGTEVDLSTLGADTRADDSSFNPHRAISFDPSGPRIAYLRLHGKREWIVIRDLTTGEETVHSPGAGKVWRIQYEPDAQFLSVQVVLDDTNGNRRKEWPYPRRQSREAPCTGPVPYYNVWEWPGDEPRRRLLRVSDGKLLEPNNLALTSGSAYISRGDDAQLWWVPEAGPRRLISSPICNGRVLHADARRDAVLVGCSSAYGARRDLLLWSSKGRVQLGIDLAAFETDSRFAHAPRMLSLYPRNDARLLDLETHTIVKLKSRDNVLATFGPRALLQRGSSLGFATLARSPNGRLGYAFESKPGRRRRPLSKIKQQGAQVAIGPDLFELAAARYSGAFEEAPLALSQAGHGLVFASRPGPAHEVRTGPIHWVTPELNQ